MSARTARIAAIAATAFNQWWELDASFVWTPYADTNATQVDPTRGNVMPKTSANAAVSGSGLWDMTGAVYSANTAALATTSITQPFLVAVGVDKNNQASTFTSCITFGLGTNSVALGFAGNVSAPVWKVSSNSGAFSASYAPQAVIAKGNVAIQWVFFDPASANTFVAGNGQNTVTSSANVSANVTSGFNNCVTFGAQFGSTTGISQMKHGIAQVVSRAGLTLAQAKAIVAKMQTAQGLGA